MESAITAGEQESRLVEGGVERGLQQGNRWCGDGMLAELYVCLCRHVCRERGVR